MKKQTTVSAIFLTTFIAATLTPTVASAATFQDAPGAGKTYPVLAATYFVNNYNKPAANKCGKEKSLRVVAPLNSAVSSIAAGKVTSVKSDKTYGLTVTVASKDKRYGTVTVRYSHLSKILVRKGMKVKTGSRIGKVGATGKTTGVHLGLTVTKSSSLTFSCFNFIDPLKWFKS